MGGSLKETTTVEVLPSGDLISDISLKMSKLNKEEAADLFKTLLEDVSLNYFKIGGILYTIKQNQWFVGDYSSYVESVMGIRAAKAYYLTCIYENLVKSGLHWEDVKHIGWSKCRVIVKLLSTSSKEEQIEWLNKAKTLTHVQLQANVTALKAGESYTEAEEKSSKLKTITFKLYEDQFPTLETAVRKAKEDLGTDSDIQAIDIIFQSYITDKFDLIITDNFIEEQINKRGLNLTMSNLYSAFGEAEVKSYVNKGNPK